MISTYFANDRKRPVWTWAKIEVDQGWRRKVDWIRLCQNFFLSPTQSLISFMLKVFWPTQLSYSWVLYVKKETFFPKVLRISALLYYYIVFSRDGLSHAEQNILFGDLEKSQILKLELNLKFMQLAFSRI